MCGRYTLTLERDDLEDRFGVTVDGSYTPRYNAAPGQKLPVITSDAPEEIRRLEWGLVPSWADDDTGGLINARAETIDEKPSFRAAYEQRRCLVPADGFYEWVETGSDGDESSGDGSGSGSNGGKQPYRVALEDDRPFAMAGLWERWEPNEETTQSGLDAFGGGVEENTADDGPLETFTIITTEPNNLIADLHHRMAVILEPGSEGKWLTADDPKRLLKPYAADEMRAYPVSQAVNNPANNDPALLEPLES
ncbi:SOS response-associated peptidase [Natronolimnobius sp. AArcel1]|uniref:SOS response-associated peptidase n=1 Tax=Natronolimnobius sp. AArcel1 TaxID=1679093 RepID=UPI0013ECB0A8|nr:SOS response-associated peptidase [Natronolimnobius sp. AArcel1]NGM68134.1 SOS response-associated peptidase [Natronolimnobius sp. AArcel1]